jgi:hypothetical protein
MEQHRNYAPPALLTFGAGYLSKSFVPGAAKPSDGLAARTVIWPLALARK